MRNISTRKEANKARAEGAEPRSISFGWVFEYIEEI